MRFAAIVLALTIVMPLSAQEVAKVGSKVPDIRLPATQVETVLPGAKDNKTLSLADFAGKKNVVLFFYPKALTKGCTIESCGFRDKLKDFQKLDTVVIGISLDTLELQSKFTEKESLNFPLLADTEGKLAKALGAAKEGSKVAARYTFVIDKTGTIRQVYTKVSVADHPNEVYNFVKDNLAK
jgi:peroxiredoxin Q/BCP